ncbi:MAG: succinylglutamate desuccinylase/aspartoacylase family protein [Bacteroidota bacterium]
MKRIIGRYIGEEKGSLFITIGAMHGNELAGIHAIQEVLKMLEAEAENNSDFVFSGQFIGLCGNLRAVKSGKRFIQKDLNRQWTNHNVRRILRETPEQLDEEDLELKELLLTIQREVEQYKPEKVFLLDLHTTSAEGGIFSIVTDDLWSLQIAVQLHAPVITGMMEGLKGTTLHYFTDAVLDVPTTAIAFESGQHFDPLSTNRAISAIINCMRSIGCVHSMIVEPRHDEILINYARRLPKVTEFVYVHKITAKDGFSMKEGFQNFQAVQKGELLARDKKGEIRAPFDALILMPLYQAQGENGFFLVKEVYQGAY